MKEGKIVYFRKDRSNMVERIFFFTRLIAETKTDIFSGISFCNVR